MDGLAVQIGKNIREARTEKGVTQSTLAQKTGINQAFISRIENGNSEGSPSQLLRIARAIGVPVSQLLEGKDVSVKVATGLSEEAINFALMWQQLPRELRGAISVTVQSLVNTRR